MSPLRLPLDGIVPAQPDLPVLEQRARDLARSVLPSELGPGEQGQSRLVVRFQLGGKPWAVESAQVQRALAQIGPVLQVPGSSGRARLVAFLHERPLPVFDLDALVGQERPRDRLTRAPAVVLRDGEGSIACAVEGPLELAELTLTHTADASALQDPSLPLAGRLSDGAMLFEPRGLKQVVARAVRSR